MLCFPLQYKSSMRILVIGGSSFFGSHLCEKLLALDHEVICVDNFFTGYKSDISHLLGNGSSSRQNFTPIYFAVRNLVWI